MSDNNITRSREKPPKVRTKIGQWFIDLWKKILTFLNEQFTGIFTRGKIFFTLIFLGGAILIAFFSLGGSNAGDGVKGAVNIITLTLVFGFLFLMVCAFIPGLAKHLFEEEGWFTKAIITVIVFALSFIITLLWFMFGKDSTIDFLNFSQLLPYIFITVFLGWNISQIHFLKDGIDSIANKVEKRLILEQVDTKKKTIAAICFLILSLLIPLLAHSFTAWGFWAQVSSSSDPNAQPRYIAWVIVIGLLFLGMDTWQVWLFIRSKKYGSINVFSSFFYLLISLIIWFRSFGFITSFVNALSTPGATVLNALGNIFLVILTAIFVLRMIATQVKKTKKMNEDAIPLLVFALVIMYIAGQVVMILGSVSDSTSQSVVNITNSSILLVSSIIYYLWYSQFILQRKDYIKRNQYTVEEIKGVINELAENIKETVSIESDKVDTAVKTLLSEHKIEENDRE